MLAQAAAGGVQPRAARRSRNRRPTFSISTEHQMGAPRQPAALPDHRRAVPTWCSRTARRPSPSRRRLRARPRRRAATQTTMPAAPVPPRGERDASERGLISAAAGCGGRFRLQLARADRAGAECPDARGPGPRNAAADAEDLARRQPAGHGRAPGAGRDRTGLARARLTADHSISRLRRSMRRPMPLQLAREPKRQRRQCDGGHQEQRHARRTGRSPVRRAHAQQSARDRCAEEKTATAVPRASGVICVALVCSVLCSM